MPAGPEPPIEIRRAEAADAPAMARLLRASITELCIEDHGHRPEVLDAWLQNKTPESVAAWIGDPDNVLLVACLGGNAELAGVAALRVDGVVGLNYVSPACRFRGVSKAMLAALERWAGPMGLGLDTLRLESTRTALAFYRAAGFVDDGPPAAKHGLATYPMRKRLPVP